MLIHRPEMTAFKRELEQALPTHVVAFDVIFQPSSEPVLWHCDYDSLGPFDSTPLSIATQDFISLHVNLMSSNSSMPGDGQLRTMESFVLSAVVYIYGRLGFLRSRGSGQRQFQRFFNRVFNGLFSLSEVLMHVFGDRRHDSTAGAANTFNNLALHSVTAGAGRVSYAVRLVRRSVLTSRANLQALTSGDRGTRRQPEFDPFIQHLHGAESMAAADFPFAAVVPTTTRV